MTYAVMQFGASERRGISSEKSVRISVPSDQLRAALTRDGRPVHYELFPLVTTLERAEADQVSECRLFYDLALPRLHWSSALLDQALLELIEGGKGLMFCASCGCDVPASETTVFCSWEPAFGAGYEYQTKTYRCRIRHEIFQYTVLSLSTLREVG